MQMIQHMKQLSEIQHIEDLCNSQEFSLFLVPQAEKSREEKNYRKSCEQ